MPNWVRNIVSVQNEKAIQETLSKENGRDLFDFQKIIPMPEELDESSDRYIKNLSIEEKLLFIKETGGIDNWYDWCVKNWDTKWNAAETVVLSNKKVMFDTAWSAPFNIFKELSKKYHTKVKVRYADEGITENSGTIIYEDGVEIDYKEGDRRFCNRVWSA